MKEIFIYQNGRQLGPLSFEDVRAMAQRGEIQADALMWLSGIADWSPAAKVLAKLEIDAQSTPPPSPPQPAAVSAPVLTKLSGDFKIRYTPTLSSSRHLNSLGLSGVGEISFAADGVHLRGKKYRVFGLGKKVDFCFQPQQVLNLIHDGKMLRFDIVSPQGKNLSIKLWAADESAALKMQQALPSTHTPGFAVIQAEAADFQTRLSAVGGVPWVTNTLVAINILVFAACALSGGGVLKPNVQVLMQWGTNFGPLTMGGEWWRLFTSMFLHFGLMHLAFNMWALYTGGQLVEKLYGSASFSLLYLGAGLCGSLASVLWHPAGNSAGASGAIMGVYGAMLAFFLRKDTLVPASIIAQQRASVLIFAGYNLLIGVSHQGIDNAAHIGGFLGGVVLGLSMVRPLDVERRAASGIRHAGHAWLRRHPSQHRPHARIAISQRRPMAG
jgi:membrane associated rhomboid family serine protease